MSDSNGDSTPHTNGHTNGSPHGNGTVDLTTENHTTKSPLPDLPPEALDLAAKIFDYARSGNTPELAQYISSGIPVNILNHKGDSLLMLAAYHGHLETVRMLLEKHADTEILNHRGQSPIAGAVFKGHDEVVRLLVHGVEGGSPGADLRAGQPNAIDSAKMFRMEKYYELFGIQTDQQ